MSLLVTSVVLTGFLAPSALAGTVSGAAAGAEPAPGPADLPAAPALRDLPAEPLLRDLPAEPPAQPARPDRERLFGSDCDTEIAGSRVTAHCHNPYPRTDLVALHVECDRWWDVDGDTVAVPVGPAGRVELTSRCWKEVRSAWVSHRPG
ncbi:hypothetical protein ACWCQL_20065 [Streptomyces sp. NPDC002073]|uniref:hypothetical protein n=1 Tax=Streptomyces sp. NBC_00239 TaxID=2903640 RepID=UPI002E2A6B03|nr:hypothetical protein [Streptomyces sp. NBC_00239]